MKIYSWIVVSVLQSITLNPAATFCICSRNAPRVSLTSHLVKPWKISLHTPQIQNPSVRTSKHPFPAQAILRSIHRIHIRILEPHWRDGSRVPPRRHDLGRCKGQVAQCWWLTLRRSVQDFFIRCVPWACSSDDRYTSKIDIHVTGTGGTHPAPVWPYSSPVKEMLVLA